MKHKNIPVFIPHLGCPNDCVFCNQRTISGVREFDESSVERTIETALTTISDGDNAEIAFFGGSFTGIDRDLMLRLLDISDRYLSAGKVSAVRCSTRPDYIDGEILGILAAHGVKTVELGIQSMNDRVLGICRRGHTSEDSRRACRMVKAAGFSLIGQMMVGLPGACAEDEEETAREICALGADGARVYPTVVFRKTALCAMSEAGEYEPLSSEAAAERTARVLRVFDSCGVPVIRVGLCASENLASEDEVFGGASHPAVGEMAMSRVFLEKIIAAADEEIRRMPDGFFASARKKCGDGIVRGGRTMVVEVPVGRASAAAGQKKRNSSALIEKYSADPGINHVKILENESLIGYNIIIRFI